MAVREVKGGILKPTGSDGIMIDGDGPMMTGTWYNPSTGHKFTVKDCFFQDGDFMVQTTAGQMLNYNTIQNYVKWEGQDVPDKPMENKPAVLPKEVANEIADYMTPEDRNLGNLNGTFNQREVHYTPVAPAEDPDAVMIKRVLGRHPIPECNAEIVWNGAPVKQLETLIDILGVDIEKITEYYIGLINKEAVFEYIKSSLGTFIEKLVNIEPPTIEKFPVEEIGEPTPVEDQPVKVKSVKKTKKTKKK